MTILYHAQGQSVKEFPGNETASSVANEATIFHVSLSKQSQKFLEIDC